MDKVSLFHLTILYLLLVIVSILFGLDDDSVKKFNLNKRWKRALWLMSGFAFIPVIVFIFRMPFFVFGQIKKFIAGKE